MDLARVVSTAAPYEWREGVWQLYDNHFSAVSETRYHVVAYDYGIKRNILRRLVECGCRLTVVPAQAPVAEVMALQP